MLVAILTDGLENASQDYTKDRINKMIAHQREVYSWEFLFLAANQDAIQSGTSMGIARHGWISNDFCLRKKKTPRIEYERVCWAGRYELDPLKSFPTC